MATPANDSKYLEAHRVASESDQQAFQSLQGRTVPLPDMPPAAPAAPPDLAPPVVVRPFKPKRVVEAYILAIALGFTGAHHFYLKRPGFGVLYLFTFGLLGVGYVVDLFRIPCLVKAANDEMRQPGKVREKSLCDAYVLWMPFGLLGAHHFYLRRWGWGVLYLFTFGLLGIGWLIDGCRMAHIVRRTNIKLAQRAQQPILRYDLSNVYVLTLFPFTGLLGAQHYYMDRVHFGLYHTFTLGGFGIAWLIDVFRMPLLVKDVNRRKLEGDDGTKRLDDCYCLMPLGFLGLHHFYLDRPCWGLLYLFTFGCFGIGWFVDIFRLPCLVSDYNKQQRARIVTPSGQIIPAHLPDGSTVIVVPAGGFPPTTAATGVYPTMPVVAAPNVVGQPLQPPPYQGGAYPPQAGAYPTQGGAYPPQGGAYPPHGGAYPPQGALEPAKTGNLSGPVVDYGTVGETSWSTINSSDLGDDPPPYDPNQEQNIPQIGTPSVPTAPPSNHDGRH